MRAYVNGSATADVSANAAPLSNFMQSLRIGAGTSSSFGFRGAIDELTLSNRALSATEVFAIASAGALGKCK